MAKKRGPTRPARNPWDTVSVGLCSRRLGTTSRLVPSPFKPDEPFTIYRDYGLTRRERGAIKDYLKGLGATLPFDDGSLRVPLPDGRAVLFVNAGGLDSPGRCLALEMELGSATTAVSSFLFTISQLGNMAISSSVGNKVIALTTPPNDRVMQRWPAAVVVSSPGELKDWLQTHIEEGTIS